MRSSVAIAIAGLLLMQVADAKAGEGGLPAELVRLREVGPDIVQDIRYAGSFNFTGHPVPGYLAPECILWRPAAEALARAQQKLAAEGYGLKVYDCYRPVRAVLAFAAWSQSPGQDAMRPVFYPSFEKSSLFELGYIARRSKHSRAIAVDIGLVRKGEPDRPTPQHAGACSGPFADRAGESSLDFGTAFDCFSPASATDARGISQAARANRDRLRTALAREGFKNYAAEWWHFEFNRPDAPQAPYDVFVR
jgi:zinc D-Ala-D-Ala dipeptidase